MDTTLGKACILKSGKFVSANSIQERFSEGLYPCYGGNGIRGYVANYSHEGTFPIIGRQGALCGNVNYAIGKFRATEHAVVVQPKEEIDTRWLYYKLISMDLGQYATGAAQPGLAVSKIEQLPINIPELSVQQQTARMFDLLERLIALRKEQLAKLDQLVKSRFIELFGDIANGPKYSSVPLGTICSTLSGGTPTTRFPEYYQGDIPWISTPYLGNNHINGSSAKAYITEAAIKNSATHLIPANTIMFGIRVGVGKSSIIDEPMCANQDIVALMDIDTSKYNLLFIKHVLDGYQSHFDSIKKGATILGVTTDDLKKVMIPMVGIELQNLFAAFVEQTDKSKLAIQQSLEKLETLKKSLMQECFG